MTAHSPDACHVVEDLTGKQLGPYQIVAALGEGGMAAVYKAYQPSMQRHVALKVLPRYYARDPQFSGRFAQEARLIASLQHPHILPVHDFGQADDYTYLVMPFISGGTLVKLLHPQRPLPLQEIRRLINQVGDALDYAHSRGIIHRDLKPSNILLDEGGNCLLSDFGLARMAESSIHFTRTGGIVGTPVYMSPEQSLGKPLDHRSDIYSLGVVLYEMATGRPPYRAETPVALLLKHAHDPLPLPATRNPDLPDAVQEVILQALAKEPAQRYARVGEMVRALQEAVEASQPVDDQVEATAAATETILSAPPTSSTLEDVPAQEGPAPSPQEPVLPPEEVRSAGGRRWRSRRFWLAGGAVLIVGVLFVAGALVFLSGGDDGAGGEEGIPQAAAGTEPTPQAAGELAAGGPAATATLEQRRAEVEAELERLRAELEEAYADDDSMRAIELISAAISLAPGRPQFYCERGRLWRDMDTFDEAARDFQQCLERAHQQELPRLVREAEAELVLTEARRAAGEADDLGPALAILEEEMGRPGVPPWLHCEKGELAMNYGAYDVAVAAFEACQRTVQDDHWQEHSAIALAMARSELAFAAGDEYAALDHLQEWAALDPRAADPHCQMGDIYFYSLNQWEDSHAAYSHCLELVAEPGAEQWAITGIYSAEAIMAREAEDWDRALGAYEALIRHDPEAPHLRCERSEIYLTVGDLGRARDDAEACLDRSGDDADLRAWAQDLLRQIDSR